MATDATTIQPIPDAAFSLDILNEGELKAQSDPASLTDRELRHIACYDQKRAQGFAGKRAEALAQRNAPKPHPAVQVVALPKEVLRYATAREDESLDEYFKRCPMSATPMFLVGVLFKFAQDTNEKNKQRNARASMRSRRASLNWSHNLG